MCGLKGVIMSIDTRGMRGGIAHDHQYEEDILWYLLNVDSIVTHYNRRRTLLTSAHVAVHSGYFI